MGQGGVRSDTAMLKVGSTLVDLNLCGKEEVERNVKRRGKLYVFGLTTEHFRQLGWRAIRKSCS